MSKAKRMSRWRNRLRRRGMLWIFMVLDRDARDRIEQPRFVESGIGNGIGFFVACAMGTESDNHRTINTRAQLAICACYIVTLLRGTNNAFPPLGSVERVGSFLRDD